MSICFSLFHYFIPFEKAMTLHLNKLEFPFPKDTLCKLVEIGPFVLAKTILKFRQCIFTFSLLYPLWNWRGPSIKQVWTPFKKDYMYQVWLKLAQRFKRRRFLILSMYFAICNYLPLEMESFFIWRNLNSRLPRMHCSKFGWNRHSGMEKKRKMWNYDNNDEEDGQWKILIRKAHVSLS